MHCVETARSRVMYVNVNVNVNVTLACLQPNGVKGSGVGQATPLLTAARFAPERVGGRQVYRTLLRQADLKQLARASSHHYLAYHNAANNGDVQSIVEFAQRVMECAWEVYGGRIGRMAMMARGGGQQQGRDATGAAAAAAGAAGGEVEGHVLELAKVGGGGGGGGCVWVYWVHVTWVITVGICLWLLVVRVVGLRVVVGLLVWFVYVAVALQRT